MTWDLRGAECNSAVPGPSRAEHEERLSEGSEGGQSQDTITREKRLTGPEGRVTYQIQRTSQDVRESRIQEAANEEFKEDFEKDVRSLSQGKNYIQFMLSYSPHYFRSYFLTMIDCKVW